MRAIPGLNPTTLDDPASKANRSPWKVLCDSATPMLIAFSDADPITGAMGGVFAGQDAGEELAAAIVQFLSRPL